MAAKYPTEPCELLQWNMIHAHNTFKLGYDNILKHLENPPLHDVSNFLGYCDAWASSIHEHHDSEEKLVFPFLQGKMDFSREIEQHKTVHAGLDGLCDWIKKARADPTAFAPSELQEIMQQLKTPLYEHLDEEVEHVSAANIRTAGLTEEDMLKLDVELTAYARAHGDPFLLVPYMRSHTPPELKDVFPPMPWMLRKVVIPYAIALRHYGYWKYSPYGMS